jgi:lysozyme family protein
VSDFANAFDSAFVATVGLEGNYSNNPADRGGPTMYGITEQVARANGYVGDMRNLPLYTAKVIYKTQYWDLLKLDDIALSTKRVAAKLFDMAVNQGVGTAARDLQRVLNVLNRQHTDYPDMPVDGVVGPMTVSNLRQLLAIRGDLGETVLFRTLNCLQGAAYIADAEKFTANEAFEFGWFANRVAG